MQEEDNVEPDGSHRGGSLTRGIPAITHHSIMYAPKCLVLVSRLDYTETFRVKTQLIKYPKKFLFAKINIFRIAWV